MARIICVASMKIGFAQINPTVGDLRGNFDKILAAYERLAARVPIWFLRRNSPLPDIRRRISSSNRTSFRKISNCWSDCTHTSDRAALLVGFVDRNEGRGKPFHNAAALLEAGQPIRKTHKSLLADLRCFR